MPLASHIHNFHPEDQESGRAVWEQADLTVDFEMESGSVPEPADKEQSRQEVESAKRYYRFLRINQEEAETARTKEDRSANQAHRPRKVPGLDNAEFPSVTSVNSQS